MIDLNADHLFLKLRESGYIQGLRMKWWNEQAECKEQEFPINPPSRLSFHDMAGICAILAVGICLSLFLLLFEIKFKHIMESCCTKSSSIPRKVMFYFLFIFCCLA